MIRSVAEFDPMLYDVMDPTPQTREEIEALIYEAFADVRLGHGISWSESEYLDLCFPEERSEEGKQDLDARWQDLVDDPNWRISRRGGGFSFLDAAGYAFYLPATMIRVLRRQEDDFSFFIYLILSRFPREMVDYKFEQWSGLSEDQCTAVALFVRHMIEGDVENSIEWLRAYIDHWHRFDPNPLK